jgi:tRNA pseudouridine-54 N-methylase
MKDLIQKRSLDFAEGEQLDVIGRILGQPRQLFDSVIVRYFGFQGATGASPYKEVADTERTFGPWKGVKDSLLGIRELTDGEYRRLLRLTILKNTTQANITAFNDGVRLLFGVDTIDYQEEVPPDYVEGAASITISIGRNYNDPEKAVFPGLDEIALADRFLGRPLGVGVLFQDPITFSANFETQSYEQFFFGTSGPTTETLTARTFNQMFTLTRPYTDTYFDINGDQQTAAIDEPRIGYDESTQEPLGLLIEGPNEVLTHTWGLEVNDSQGTFRLALTHDNRTETEVAFIIEGQDFKMILFREDTYWKLRTEWDTSESYEALITQATSDSIVANISYTPGGVYFAIGTENRFAVIVGAFGQTNIRSFDMRIGGSFTTNAGDVYGHFNGKVRQLVYLRPYIGVNERIVVNGIQITTEEYERIITEYGGLNPPETPVELFLYSGGKDDTLRRIDSEGNQVWVFTGHSDPIYSLAVDSSGTVYSGSLDNTLRKIGSNGVEIWSFDFGSALVAVAVDAIGNVYGGSQDSTVRKLSSNGVQIWSFGGHSGRVNAVAVDANGNVYSGGFDHTVRKISSSGSQIWVNTDSSNDVLIVAVDSTGNVYSGDLDGEVRKFDSDGNQIWINTDHVQAVSGLAVDSDGNVYTGSADGEVKKIDSSGNEVWTFDFRSNVLRVSLDANGNVYATGRTDFTVRKISPEGNQVWIFGEHTDDVQAVASVLAPIAVGSIE